MQPYYDQDGIVIYHADCCEVLPSLETVDLVLTDPPYPNGEGYFDEGIASARQVLRTVAASVIMTFWSEREIPACSLPIVATHIWHRTNVNGKVYEPIFHFAQDGIKRRSEIKRGAAVFSGAGPGCNEYLGHPTQKPLHVIKWLLHKAVASTCLDPFMGSGTTLRAAKDLGLRAIGIEIEEKYCEIAAERLRQRSLFEVEAVG